MRELAEEFKLAIPARADMIDNFQKVISDLKTEREIHLAEGAYLNIAALYRAELNSMSGNLDPLPLLISAWGDDRSGIKDAYQSTYSWFAELNNIEPRWKKLLSEVSSVLKDHNCESQL